MSGLMRWSGHVNNLPQFSFSVVTKNIHWRKLTVNLIVFLMSLLLFSSSAAKSRSSPYACFLFHFLMCNKGVLSLESGWTWSGMTEHDSNKVKLVILTRLFYAICLLKERASLYGWKLDMLRLIWFKVRYDCLCNLVRQSQGSALVQIS